VYRSFCKFRFGRWQEAARRHGTMTYAVLLEHGLDGAGEALRILVNEAAKIERSEFLGAAPYERTATRRNYANGFKPKTILTRVGELTFEVPASAFRRLLSFRPGEGYSHRSGGPSRLGRDVCSRRLHQPGHRHNCYTALGLV
jgi:hypothetical protein